jgi:hypothetical protein
MIFMFELKKKKKNLRRELLCLEFQVMLDTVGAELQVVNKRETSISLQADAFVVLTPHQDQEATSELLPINFDGLSKVLLYIL